MEGQFFNFRLDPALRAMKPVNVLLLFHTQSTSNNFCRGHHVFFFDRLFTCQLVARKQTAAPISNTILVLWNLVTVVSLFQILDANRDSPLLQFTVVIKHAAGSPVNAASLTVIDRIDDIVHYTSNVKPAGKVDVTTDYLKGSVLIRATVQSLEGMI